MSVELDSQERLADQHRRLREVKDQRLASVKAEGDALTDKIGEETAARRRGQDERWQQLTQAIEVLQSQQLVTQHLLARLLAAVEMPKPEPSDQVCDDECRSAVGPGPMNR